MVYFYSGVVMYRPFLKRFIDNAKGLRVGTGLEPEVEMGPLANARRLAAMEELVRNARAHGSSVATGGQYIGNRGFFWQPTVLT